MEEAVAICPLCGMRHPADVLCGAVKAVARSGHGHGSHDGSRESAGGRTAPARVTFRVEDMDCPVEEKMVREALEGLPGVTSLAFDLPRRSVAVGHDGSALAAVTAALEGLGLGAVTLTDGRGREAREQHQERCHGHAGDTHACGCAHAGAFLPDTTPLTSAEVTDTRAVYRISNMDCPVEEALIRKAIERMPGVRHLEFDLMRRVLTVDHDPGDTTAIEDALRAIDMTPEPFAAAALSRALFLVPEMDCPVEEKMVRDALARVPGVRGVECDLVRRMVRIHHDSGCLPAVSAALGNLGLGARLAEAGDGAASAPRKALLDWKRLAAACALAALSEAAEIIGHWGLRPLGMDMASWEVAGVPVLPLAALLLAVLAILLSGVGTYRKGWLAVRNRNLNINALMSVAVTGAVLIGEFPEAAMVMVLFTISEALEARALNTARDAIRELLALSPERATVQGPDGAWRSMDIREVAAGSRVRVQPGEKVALDGTIVAGHSTVNQAPITGESMPVEKRPGDHVWAGTINEAGSFEFVSTALSTDTTLARVIRTVEEAQSAKAPTQRFVDVFATWYTPAIFLAALATALLTPLALGWAWTEAIYTGLVILVIGCPCALVISTPVSVVSGLAAATRAGILVKGGVYLEQGRRLRAIALDKTGTLTHGRPELTGFMAMGGMEEGAVLALAASLAARSDHPVSRALAAHAAARDIPLAEVTDFEAIPGAGVRGAMGGHIWYLGSPRLARDLGVASPALEEEVETHEKEGRSVVLLMDSDGVRGLFHVADTIRESSVEAIAELRRLGVRTVMLTGDNRHTAEAIGRQAGVDEVRAGLLPEAKLAAIEELRGDGAVVGMVGDGINDAPALARAGIGFAMARQGTDTAIETADVALMDDDLRKLPRFIRLSRATCAILAENITLALVIKSLCLLLTFTGHVNMLIAVFADVGTTLLVVANGLRAARK